MGGVYAKLVEPPTSHERKTQGKTLRLYAICLQGAVPHLITSVWHYSGKEAIRRFYEIYHNKSGETELNRAEDYDLRDHNY